MKTYIIRTLCIFTFLAALAAGLHYYLLDGLDGLLFGLMFTEDSVYAAGYSDSAFRHVEIGMTLSEVHKLLGSPLDHWESGGTYGERWSKSPHDTDYRCRVLLFEKGRVVQKHAEYYVD